MSDKTAQPRKPRADSIRNRKRLLAAAAEVFSVGGPDASLEAVARTAEVGIGTLYRHFPTREALFQAVYQNEVGELVELATRLGEEMEPIDAIRRWLRACVRMVAMKKGMVAALAPVLDANASIYADNAARLRGALAGLLDRAVAARLVRDDVSADEVLRVMIALCYSREMQAGAQDEIIRLLDIFVDGLGAPRP
ncbi:TetR/AcrR family transcriptional regulator [Acuticoccus sp. M5D2P5]|uniref:TetR/AcrR family transcriptional regulator n=1 Tax=Acuticoccus kalidii TaxID=2910977 RepID=UPI001F44064B|nr:TetR/AcrR family transcriptional regulator [Acuticoccus kalidii]MCF3932000.1 TetR/AcrR family transcriptional regulator [Acuticoccus kalidii]